MASVGVPTPVVQGSMTTFVMDQDVSTRTEEVPPVSLVVPTTLLRRLAVPAVLQVEAEEMGIEKTQTYREKTVSPQIIS